LPVAIYLGLWAFLAALSMIPEVGPEIERHLDASSAEYATLAQQDLQVFSNGSLGAIFIQRAKNVLFTYQFTWVFVPTLFAMFLLGQYAARRRFLHDIGAHTAFLRRVLMVGLPLGLLLNVIYTMTYTSATAMEINLRWVATATCLSIGGPVLTLGYIATLSLLLQRPRWQIFSRPLAAAGRMALSNYLIQSLVCTTLFYSYGLGWYGSVGRAAGVGLALLIYLAQLPISVWWLNRFRFGPAEWLWRSLTYGTPQPMKN
jgi:uncharacterized protein